MATKLYVGNLSYKTNDADLNQLFGEFGTVTSAQVLVDRYSGQSRGFGFVEMSTDEEAQKAIGGLNGRNVDGRPLTVNESRPREERSGGGGGGGNRYSGSNRSGGGDGGGRSRY
jgi:cold-inducible RNA-binding protein